MFPCRATASLLCAMIVLSWSVVSVVAVFIWLSAPLCVLALHKTSTTIGVLPPPVPYLATTHPATFTGPTTRESAGCVSNTHAIVRFSLVQR